MKHLPVAIAAVLVALSFFPGRQPPAGPVAKALASATSADRARVRGIYAGLADVTERDGGSQIANVSIWREVHRSALRLAAGEMRGKYQGLDVAVEEVLAKHFPLDDVTLTKELAGKIAAGCREVAKQSD